MAYGLQIFDANGVLMLDTPNACVFTLGRISGTLGPNSSTVESVPSFTADMALMNVNGTSVIWAEYTAAGQITVHNDSNYSTLNYDFLIIGGEEA